MKSPPGINLDAKCKQASVGSVIMTTAHRQSERLMADHHSLQRSLQRGALVVCFESLDEWGGTSSKIAINVIINNIIIITIVVIISISINSFRSTVVLL